MTTNYYDLIKVPTNASQVEISIAIIQLENLCNNYINQSNDSAKIEQGRSILANLNIIRTTLLNPIQREKYDRSIGIVGSTCSEPQSSNGTQSNESETGGFSPTQTPTQINVSGLPGNKLWFCQKCQTQNMEGYRHCQKCGSIIGRDCPNCGAIIPSSAVYCGKCGVDITAHEKEKAKQQRIKDNLSRISVLHEQITLGMEEIEDWQDVIAGSFPSEIDIRSSSPCYRKFRRMEASVKPANLTGLWLLISVLIGLFVGFVVRIPSDIALYVGLFFSLPVALSVLRFGGGCAGSLATLCVAGTIGAAVVAWGGPILIGIFAGLISIPIVILLGKAIQDKSSKNAIQTMAYEELQKAKNKVQRYEAEVNQLSGN